MGRGLDFQALDVRPARNGVAAARNLCVFDVDDTSNEFDLSDTDKLGALITVKEGIYLTFTATDANVFYFIDDTTGRTVDDTATFDTNPLNQCEMIPVGIPTTVRVHKGEHFLYVKCSSGNNTRLRVRASSEP